MQPDAGRLARKLRIATLAILLVGATAATGAYLAATLGPQEPDAASRLETKQYRHDLEVFGGKANLLAADFMEWYSGLWHGTNLAFTILFLTAVSAGALRLLGAALKRREGPLPPARVVPFPGTAVKGDPRTGTRRSGT